MNFAIVPGTFAVARLSPEQEIPTWAVIGERKHLLSITYTREELSIVCAEEQVPAEVKCERDWRVLQIVGPLDFALVGILARVATTLAQGGISIFALSTYDTDYILVKERVLAKAVALLEQDGHAFTMSD
jgi:hypothetical protein